MIQAFRKDTTSLQGILPSINEFVVNPHLDGAAWKGMKNQLAAHQTVIQGLIAANDGMVRDSETFSSQVGDENLEEEKLKESIEKLTNQNQTMARTIESYEYKVNTLTGIEKMIDSLAFLKRMYYISQINDLTEIIATNEQLIQKWEEKLEKLYQIEASTQSLFQEANSLYEAATQGMEAIGSSFTGTGFNLPSSSIWMSTLKKGWEERADRNACHELKKAGFTEQDIQRLKKLGYSSEDVQKYVSRTMDEEERKKNAKDVLAVLDFETNHLEEAKRVGNFLSPLTFNDTMDIKYLMYTAEEPYRTLSMKYLDRFRITQTKPVSQDDSGSGFFSSDGEFYFDVATDRMGSKGRGKFFTFFHELGHVVDYYAGQDNGYPSFFTESYQLNGLTLDGYNEKDVKTMLGKSLDEILNGNYQNSEEIKRTITDSLYDPKIVSKHSLSGDAKEVYNTLYNNYEKYFSEITSFGTADVYHGITNFDIIGRYEGHSKGNYFYDKSGNLKNNTGKENFGTYFSYNMIDGDSGSKHLATYLPESIQYMDLAVNSMK